jgi:hypothetical protein
MVVRSLGLKKPRPEQPETEVLVTNVGGSR